MMNKTQQSDTQSTASIFTTYLNKQIIKRNVKKLDRPVICCRWNKNLLVTHVNVSSPNITSFPCISIISNHWSLSPACPLSFHQLFFLIRSLLHSIVVRYLAAGTSAIPRSQVPPGGLYRSLSPPGGTCGSYATKIRFDTFPVDFHQVPPGGLDDL